MTSSSTAKYCPLHKEQLANPYPFYEQARKDTPVFYTEDLLDRGVYVITRYEDVVHVLSQPDLFSSRDTLYPLVPWGPRTFAELSKGYPPLPIHINSDGAAHRRFRIPLAKAFSPARIKLLEPAIRAHTQALLDHVIDAHQMDVIADFAYPLPLDIILLLFHLPEEDRTQVKGWCDDWLSLVSARLDEDRQVACARSVVEFQTYIARLIEARRQAPLEQDLVTDMTQHQEPGEAPLSVAELVHSLGGILLAGHETSTNMIGNGLAFLLSHREHWQRLCEEPELIPEYLDELLRFDTPAHTFFRTSTQETEIGGTIIPANALLLVLFGSAHRDEAHFVHADQFLPERQERNFAFGFGRHFCVGASLARLEGKVAFEALTQRLPALRLSANQPFEHLETLMFRGYKQLLVEW